MWLRHYLVNNRDAFQNGCIHEEMYGLYFWETLISLPVLSFLTLVVDQIVIQDESYIMMKAVNIVIVL